MKKTLIFSAILFIASLSYAQTKEELKVKFGKLSDKEMAMTSYDKDPDAPAVVLFDKGYVSLGNFNTYERHIRIKIFKKEAYEKANFRIIFSRYNHEAVDGLKASCFNLENGKWVETKATSDNIHDEEINKFMNVKKVTVPGVHEGSIIDVKYGINNPSSIRDWSFQDDVPTIWSEYEMAIPEYYIFSKIGQGSTPYTLNETNKKNETLLGTNYSYGLNTYHWIQKDVPAIKPETYMSSIEDYRTRVTFHLEEIRPPQQLVIKIMDTWKETAKKLMEDDDFGDFIDRKGAMKDELATFIKEDMTPLEKVQAVYDYVGKNFETESYTYSSVYVTTFLKEMKRKRKVTSSEINLIFLNMLKTLGIKATPVLTRSRDDGRVATNLAALRRFNKVISYVKIEKDTFFVDASGYPQPMKLLPFNALSGYGVEIIDKEKYEIVVPQSKINTRRFSQAILSLNTEGVLSGDVNFTYGGYEAFKNRKALKDMGEDKYLQAAIKDLITDGKLESHKYENTDINTDLPFKGTAKITSSAFVNKTDDKMYINPMLCFGIKENPFKAEERKFDIDFGAPRDEYFQMSLTIPEGYKVEESPKSARLQLPEGAMKFEYLIEIKDNTISINTKLLVKKTNFFADEYPLLKDLYAKMLAKMGEQIVLTKATK
jgi:hypothetical protein